MSYGLSDDELNDELDPLVFAIASNFAASGNSHTKNTENGQTKQEPPLQYRIDADALSTYIYPTNLQVRDYQYNIVHRSIFHNTLVVLPTGLGKTFIASTVMLNYYRWFPGLKIVFMAPTKPLVAQQIKACCGITGLPSLEMAVLLDMNRKNRASIWAEKSVFFTTPQVVDNDLKYGTVDPRDISLLVIDEAHRAKGNYAYNTVVQFMDRFNMNYRILGMTATPASTVEGVQEIINNLHISKAEVRTEKSVDICKYLKHKTIERFHAEPSEDVQYAVDCISTAAAPLLKMANEKRIYEVTDPSKINAFTAMDALRRLVANKTINEGAKWAGHRILQDLAVAGQCLRRLNIYGIRSFYSYFKEKYNESLAKTKKLKKLSIASNFYQHTEITNLMNFCEERIKDPAYLGHEKLEIVVNELKSFFRTTENLDSRVIIFSEFRQAALDIVRALEQLDSSLKPHIFIGQAKDSKSEESKLFAAIKKAGKSTKGSEEDTGHSSSEMAQLTGMSQKVQKETIRKFKAGDYNVLVATSIGEEGLDIGEVDLIVCYDSTSSPIKNIQRMGRTGRNRDGKILLLFSANEEMKFDKAMNGYEYIQQHIMSGDLIELHDQKRLIPRDFNPTAEERFIEIPEENTAFKEEADDDEIIKIATKYMTGGIPKAKKGTKAPYKRPPDQPKLLKRFFMPDNVVTGFQLASVVARTSSRGENEEFEDDTPISALSREDFIEVVDPPPKRQKTPKSKEQDILDRMLDSDSGISSDESSGGTLSPPKVISQKSARKEEALFEEESNVIPKSTAPSRGPVPEKLASPLGVKPLRQSQLESLLSAKSSSKTPSPLLGVRERALTQINMGPNKQPSASGNTPNASIMVDSESSADEKPDELDDDDFSDEDDDEILALARKTQSGDWQIRTSTSQNDAHVPSHMNISEPLGIQDSAPAPKSDVISDSDDIERSFMSPGELSEKEHFPLQNAHEAEVAQKHSSDTSEVFVLSAESGILTPTELDDLYMNYYEPVDGYDLQKYAVPQPPTQNARNAFQGKKAAAYLDFLLTLAAISPANASDLAVKYRRAALRALPPMKDCIDFD